MTPYTHHRSKARQDRLFNAKQEQERHKQKLDQAAAKEDLRLLKMRQRQEIAAALMPQALKDELSALLNLPRELTQEEWMHLSDLQHMMDGNGGAS